MSTQAADLPRRIPGAGVATETAPAAQQHEAEASAGVVRFGLEGLDRTIIVNDRQPLHDEAYAVWRWGAHLGKVVGTYDLPRKGDSPFVDVDQQAVADHQLHIFDSNNSSARHAGPKTYTIATTAALERLAASRLNSKQDAFTDPEIMELTEGMTLRIGRADGNWLPATISRTDPSPAVSREQAEFRVVDGNLVLTTEGFNGGAFVGIPSQQEVRRWQQQALRDKEMSRKVHRARVAAGVGRATAADAVQLDDYYVGGTTDTRVMPRLQPHVVIPTGGRRRYQAKHAK